MKAEERKEFKVKNYADMKLGFDGFIDIVRETNDEVLQVEELRTHVERLKEDLVHYFTDIMGKYEIELTIPAESFSFSDMDENSLQAAFVNDSGIISYHLKSGSVKSDRLNDYSPSELMNLFGVVMPHLKDVLKVKRKEYEETSNALSKIRKYLTLLKGKVQGGT